MRSLIFVASLLVTFALGAPAASDQLVQTPGGLRPASSGRQVPVGGSLKIAGNQIHLLDASGSVIHVATIDNATAQAKTASKATSKTPPEASGWISYAYWYNTGSSPINSFITNWVVPPVPSTWNNQLLYYFNSIEPAAGDAILQPVLQYGVSPAGGGQYWSVATWYVYSGGYYFSPLVAVSPGQVLQGVIQLESVSGTSYSYLSYFSGINGLLLSGSAQLVWATETLESYGVTARSDYPTPNTVFYNINLSTTTGVPAVSWSTANDPADGISTTVAINGATNAEVYVTY